MLAYVLQPPLSFLYFSFLILSYSVGMPTDPVGADGFEPGSWAKSSIQPVVVNALSFEDTLTMKIISALSRAMDQSTCRIRALLITNPHIPFGQCYPLEVLEACVRFCNQRGIHFISNEEYGLTSFPSAEIPDPVPFISALSLDDRALGCDPSRSHTIYGISRDFGASNFHMVRPSSISCALDSRTLALV